MSTVEPIDRTAVPDAGEADQPATKEEKRNAIIQWFARDLPNIDPSYGVTIIKSIYRLCGAGVRGEVVRRHRIAVADEAAKDYRATADHNETVQDLVDRYNSINEQFKAQVNALREAHRTLQNSYVVDMLRMTGHGKRALDEGGAILNQAYKGVEHAWKRNEDYRPELDKSIKAAGDDLDVPAGANLGLAAAVFDAIAKSVLAETRRAMKSAAEGLDGAQEYESFKAYAKANPDKVSEAVENVEKAAGHLMGAVEVVASVAPDETAKTIMEGTHAIADVLISFAAKAAKSGAADRQVKKIMGSKKKRAEAVAYLQQNRLTVAKYLAEKYVASIEHNFTMVNVVAVGGQLGLNAALKTIGADAVIGSVVSLAWKLTRRTIITVARELQESRITAAEKLIEAEEAAAAGLNGAVQGMADGVGQLLAGGLAAEEKSILDRVRDSAQEVFEGAVKGNEKVFQNIAKNAKKNAFEVLSPQKLLMNILQETVIAKLVAWAMSEIKVVPAQKMSDDLLAMLATGPTRN
jgi:hypothetical protein